MGAWNFEPNVTVDLYQEVGYGVVPVGGPTVTLAGQLLTPARQSLAQPVQVGGGPIPWSQVWLPRLVLPAPLLLASAPCPQTLLPNPGANTATYIGLHTGLDLVLFPYSVWWQVADVSPHFVATGGTPAGVMDVVFLTLLGVMLG